MIIRKTALAVAVLAMAGCASITDNRRADGSFDYADLQAQPTLQAPAPLKAPASNGQYHIPALKTPGDVGKMLDIRAPKLVLALPDNATLDESEAGAKVRFDARRGMDNVVSVVNSRLASWLKARDIPVENSSATEIDTAWFIPHQRERLLNDVDAGDVKRRFAIHIKAAEHGRTVEVSVASLGVDANGTEPEAVNDNEWASVMLLNDYLAYYAEQDQLHHRELVLSKYQPIGVTLGQDNNGAAAFILKADFERSWNRLPMVLEHMGFEIRDYDKSQAILYVTYDGSPDSSFWSGLFGGSDKDLSLKHRKYRVQLGEMGENTTVTFSTDKGQPITNAQYSEMNNLFSGLMRDDGLKEVKK